MPQGRGESRTSGASLLYVCTDQRRTETADGTCTTVSVFPPGTSEEKGNVVNLLGFFSPLVDDCELYDLLHSAGIKTIHEISRCRNFEEYKTMSEANFNLVLHQESRFAAEDF